MLSILQFCSTRNNHKGLLSNTIGNKYSENADQVVKRK